VTGEIESNGTHAKKFVETAMTLENTNVMTGTSSQETAAVSFASSK